MERILQPTDKSSPDDRITPYALKIFQSMLFWESHCECVVLPGIKKKCEPCKKRDDLDEMLGAELHLDPWEFPTVPLYGIAYHGDDPSSQQAQQRYDQLLAALWERERRHPGKLPRRLPLAELLAAVEDMRRKRPTNVAE